MFWSSHIGFRVRISGPCSHLKFAFMIHDMIGRGVICGDVMTNSFMFSQDSCWHVTKSVVFLELL